jgi:Putative Ig domain
MVLQATGNWSPLTWSLKSGALPAGLTLDPKTGTIAGTTPNVGLQQLATIQAGDSKALATKQFTFNIYPKDSLNPITAANAHLNVPYSLTITGVGTTDPTESSFSISTGTLPPGLSFSVAPSGANYLASISGIATQVGSYPFTIQMKDTTISDLTQTVTAAATIIVDDNVTITKWGLKNAVQGKAFSDTFSAVDGKPPYQWSITGNVPPGLTLNASSGALSGTALSSGLYSYTVSVTDSSSPVESDKATNSMTVAVPLAIAVSASLPTANLRQTYPSALAATGGTTPYSWSVISGSLPPGMALSTDGSFSGAPSQLGTFNFTAQVSDSGTPPQTASRAFTLTVQPQPLVGIGQILSPAPVNVLYHSQVPVTGGTPPYSWIVSSGILPSGLNLNAATGDVDGTPTQAGTFNFIATITDSGNPIQTSSPSEIIMIRKGLGRNDSIATATPLGNSVNNASPPTFFSISPYIDPIGATTANPDTDYYRLVATGGSAVHVETVADRAFGGPVLTDTVVELLNASGQRITSCEAPAYTSACLNDDIDSTTKDSALDIKVPGAANVSTTFYVHVLDWRGDARPDLQYYLNVSGVIEPLKLSPTTLGPGATRGVSYSQQFTTTGGTGTSTWSVSGGALPPGWSLSTSGLLSGMATTDGTYAFTIKATDAANPPQIATQQYTQQIAEPLTITSPATFPNACVDKPYSFQVTTSGGLPPVSFGFSSSAWVAINLLDQNSGIFSGMTNVTGTFTGRLSAGDSAQPPSGQLQTVTLTVVTCP